MRLTRLKLDRSLVRLPCLFSLVGIPIDVTEESPGVCSVRVVSNQCFEDTLCLRFSPGPDVQLGEPV